MTDIDPRLFAPATQRNRDAIRDVLRRCLPPAGLVLEIASGSGEHAMYFARHFPQLDFQPSDASVESRTSIAGWIATESLGNIRPPIALDAAAPDWPINATDAVLCINMVHISPWTATLGLFKGAARLLQAGAPLYLYGPYVQEGTETAPSNLAFDRDLRARNPAWGLRNLATVTAVADEAGFGPPEIVPMPANNLSLIYRRR